MIYMLYDIYNVIYLLAAIG